MSQRALRLRLSAVLALLLAFGALAAARQQTTPAVPAASVERIEKAVTAFMATVNAPGLSLAMGLDGQLRFENGYGLADIENYVPAKATTVYRLASVSKPITAVAAMQLVERHRPNLNDLGWIVEGWGIPDAPRIPGLVWHGGVQQGVTTNLYMLLPDRSVVAVMTNVEGEGLALTKLASELTNIVLGRGNREGNRT